MRKQQSSNFRCYATALKHAFPTRETVFFVWSVQSDYKEGFRWRGIESSFETPACQGMRLGAEELNSVESSELAVVEYWQERN
jgi:hypothetical protein